MSDLSKFAVRYCLHLLGCKSKNFYPGMRNAYVQSKGKNASLSRLNSFLYPAKSHSAKAVIVPPNQDMVRQKSGFQKSRLFSQFVNL